MTENAPEKLDHLLLNFLRLFFTSESFFMLFILPGLILLSNFHQSTSCCFETYLRCLAIMKPVAKAARQPVSCPGLSAGLHSQTPLQLAVAMG